MEKTLSKETGGLANVVAGTTAICEVTQDSLRYRGYEIADLAARCQFEEVAYLLLYGELPTREELDAFQELVRSAMVVPESVARVVTDVSRDVPFMDVLRSAVSLLSHEDIDQADNSTEANRRKAVRLMGQIAAVIGLRNRRIQNLPGIEIDPRGSHVGNLLRLLTGRQPTEAETRVMNLSLILYAEHDYNASTFTARVVVGTLSDLHSGVTAAIGALKGPLHGGANEAAMEMLIEIGSPVAAETFVRDAFATKRKLMGFGHRIYKNGDHRARILEAGARELCDAVGQHHWTEIAEIVAGMIFREKKIHPNLDWPAARAYYAMDLPIEVYTPIFVASRITGWCAHIIEQLEDNRLIRPVSEYTGPEPRTVRGEK